MARGDVAEGQRRAEIDAASGVVTAHDAGHVAARRVQAGDGLRRAVQDLGMMVDLEPGEGTEAARLDFHGIEGALFDRRDAWVGLLQCVTLLAVVSKLIGCGLAAKSLGTKGAWIVGVGMVPRGEVGIIVASLGKQAGVFGAGAYAIIIAMSLLTSVVAPPALKVLLKGRRDPSTA